MANFVNNNGMGPVLGAAFFFDIDETLVEVQRNETSQSRLSDSAQGHLSQSVEGCIEEPVVLAVGYQKARAHKVRAIAREAFGEFFERVQDINDRYGEKPIKVYLLTNANYSENEITDILKEIHPALEVDGFANYYREHSDKGEHMAMVYRDELEQLGIQKRDVVLIDDSKSNCMSAKAENFSAIHMRTNPNVRDDDHSFTSQKPKIFQELHDRLDNVEFTNAAIPPSFLPKCTII